MNAPMKPDAFTAPATDMIADALRDSILRDIEYSAETGDAKLDVLRNSVARLAALALGEIVWHDPRETFTAAFGAAIRGGVPATMARGILIAAFGDDYSQLGTADPVQSIRPAAIHAMPLPNDDWLPLNTGPDDVTPLRVREPMPGIPEPAVTVAEPYTTKVGRALALAPDATAKLAELERLAIEASKNIDDGGQYHGDALDTLIDAAKAQGLDDRFGLSTIEHVVGEGLRGRSATEWRRARNAQEGAKKLARAHDHLDVRRMSDVESKKTEWLWRGRIAIGKQTLIGGEPGLGKSQLTAAIAAAVTTGGEWPCDEGRAPVGSVVILSAEDDAADTIRPRLDAAGADASRVFQIAAVSQRDGSGRRVFNLQADLPLLEREIERVGDVRLVIIDPVSSYMGKTDSHKNADVRGTLEPLGDMASRLRVAVVSITHFSKGGNTALNSFIGSIAFIAAARAAFMVTRDPDSEDKARRLFIMAKNNLAADSGGLAFRIEQHLLPGEIVATAIAWDGERINRTADEILAAVADDKAGSASRGDAEDLLRGLLAGGPVPSNEIMADARGAGISPRTLRRAQKALGIRAERKAESGDGLGKAGRWYWALPRGSP